MRAFLGDDDIPPGMRIFVYGVDDTFGPWLLHRLRGRGFLGIGFIGPYPGTAHGFPVLAVADYRAVAGDLVLLALDNFRAEFLAFSGQHLGAWCLNAVPYCDLRFHEYCIAAPVEELRKLPDAHIPIEVKAVAGFAQRYVGKTDVVFDLGANT